MYLYLGQSTVIPFQEIMGIFDLDNASWAYKTREFLERAEREGRAVWLTDDLPRSVVVADRRGGGTQVYFSPFSPATLRGRAERGAWEP